MRKKFALPPRFNLFLWTSKIDFKRLFPMFLPMICGRGILKMHSKKRLKKEKSIFDRTFFKNNHDHVIIKTAQIIVIYFSHHIT